MNEGIAGLLFGVIFGIFVYYMFHDDRLEKTRWKLYEKESKISTLKHEINKLKADIERKDEQLSKLTYIIEDLHESKKTHQQMDERNK